MVLSKNQRKQRANTKKNNSIDKSLANLFMQFGNPACSHVPNINRMQLCNHLHKQTLQLITISHMNGSTFEISFFVHVYNASVSRAWQK